MDEFLLCVKEFYGYQFQLIIIFRGYYKNHPIKQNLFIPIIIYFKMILWSYFAFKIIVHECK